jgi:hypothetical protein
MSREHMQLQPHIARRTNWASVCVLNSPEIKHRLEARTHTYRRCNMRNIIWNSVRPDFNLALRANGSRSYNILFAGGQPANSARSNERRLLAALIVLPSIPWCCERNIRHRKCASPGVICSAQEAIGVLQLCPFCQQSLLALAWKVGASCALQIERGAEFWHHFPSWF